MARPGPKPEALSARFERMTDRSGECWEWQGTIDAYGYGILTVSDLLVTSRKMKAHRLAWYLAHGEFPDLLVLHRCDNRRCVRVDHLFLGDQAANVRDALNKGRHISQKATM